MGGEALAGVLLAFTTVASLLLFAFFVLCLIARAATKYVMFTMVSASLATVALAAHSSDPPGFLAGFLFWFWLVGAGIGLLALIVRWIRGERRAATEVQVADVKR